ncbi:MAG: L,D-transpeptidase family protein [Chloroflexota bacterium]
MIHLILIGICLDVVLAAWCGALIYQTLQERILPGTVIIGTRIELSSLTESEAAVYLESAWADHYLIVSEKERDEGSAFSVRATELGFIIDAAETAASANRASQPQSINDWINLFNQLRYGSAVAPILSLDTAQTEQALQAINDTYAYPAIDAALRFEGENLIIEHASDGRAINIDQTLSSIVQDPGQLFNTGRLTFSTEMISPAIDNESAMLVQSQLNQRLNQDLAILLFDPISNQEITWPIKQSTWNSWLTFAGSVSDPYWEIDMIAIDAYIEDQTLPASTYQIETAEALAAIEQLVQQQLNGQSKSQETLRLYHRPSTHTVGPGETFASIARQHGMPYPYLQSANPGIGEDLSIGQALTIPSPDTFLPLPVVRHKRIVISLTEQKMWAYEHGEIKWEWVISSGIASSPTSPGVFQIRSHEPNAYAGNWDLWMPNFMGIYQPVPNSEFMNGFHGFPTRNGSNLLWTNSLGTPVTYGCILVGNEQMVELYKWGEAGTVVEIQP